MVYLNNQYPKFRYCDKLNLVTAKQNQKFPFHFLSASPTPPAEENKKGKENFWVCPRPKGADEVRRLERTIQFQATTRSARAISSFRQGSARNAVEFCSIHTANFQNGFRERKLGRAEGATPRHSPRRIQNPKGFSTLRVAPRLPIQFYE